MNDINKSKRGRSTAESTAGERAPSPGAGMADAELIAALNPFERLVFSIVRTMPPKVRMAAYALLLSLLAFYFFVPSELGGTVAEPSGGALREFPDAVVSSVRGSVRYYVEGGKDGTWKILAPGRIPGNYEIEFATTGNRTSKESIATCWTDFLPGTRIKVHYHEDATSRRFVRVDDGCDPEGAVDATDAVAADADGVLGGFHPLGTAWAQADRVAIPAPEKVREDVALALEQAGVPAARTPQATPAFVDKVAAAASRLHVDIPAEEILASTNEGGLVDQFQRHIYQEQLADRDPVYLYAGEVARDGNWATQYFSPLEEADEKPILSGDVVQAQQAVNMRSDYIRRGLFGWRNADSLGVTRKGDTFVVQETRLIGSHLWMKAVPVVVESK